MLIAESISIIEANGYFAKLLHLKRTHFMHCKSDLQAQACNICSRDENGNGLRFLEKIHIAHTGCSKMSHKEIVTQIVLGKFMECPSCQLQLAVSPK